MKIVFRVDASTELGTGHVIRCLTLAEYLRSIKGIEIFFICRNVNGHLADYLFGKEFNVILIGEKDHHNFSAEMDRKETVPILQSIGQIDWLIVDHYHLDSFWESKMRPYTKKIMVIDDLANRKHDCDLLLDQTFGLNESVYSHLIPGHCQTLLGTRYALLRKSFRAYQKDKPPQFNHRLIHVHVFFGGVDSNNYTFRFSKLLMTHFPYIKLKAVVGKMYPYIETLQQLEEKDSGRFTWEQDIPDMAYSLSTCDIAFGAPGMTTWERACIGVPAAYLTTASNQQTIVKNLEQNNLCVYLGDARTINPKECIHKFSRFINNPEKLVGLYKMGVKSVDGLGADRVLKHLREGVGE